MNCCSINASQGNQSYFRANCLPNLILITGIALAIIGILAGLEVKGFTSLSNHWYLFELGAAFCFAVRIIVCCRSFCNKIAARRKEAISQQTTSSKSAEKKSSPPKTPGEKAFLAAYLPGSTAVDRLKAYKNAWKLGYEPAGFYLAEHYEKNGPTQNIVKSLIKYHELAEKGNLEAIYYLAHKAANESNKSEFLKWMQQALKSEKNETRLKSLNSTLTTFNQPVPSLDPTQYTSAESKTMASSFNAKIFSETNNLVTASSALSLYNFYIEEFRARQKIINDLIEQK